MKKLAELQTAEFVDLLALPLRWRVPWAPHSPLWCAV